MPLFANLTVLRSRRDRLIESLRAAIDPRHNAEFDALVEQACADSPYCYGPLQEMVGQEQELLLRDFYNTQAYLGRAERSTYAKEMACH